MRTILNSESSPAQSAESMATVALTPATDLPASQEAQPLCALPAHASARVVRVDAGHEDAVRLMALGVCVGRRIQVVKPGDPIIVQVVGTRVGLSARLAAGVLVEPLAAAGSGKPAA